MKKLLKVALRLAAAALISLSVMPLGASAGEPYDVYNYDSRGSAIPSQAGYTAEKTVSGYDLGIGALDSPSDIFCDKNNSFFIADKGNDRIIAVDSKFERALKIYDSFTMPDGTKTTLNSPSGVFVSAENNLIYIADSENSRVLISDRAGNVVSEIKKPESEVYDQRKTFLPQRVIADKAGNVYVVLNNITTGAAMFKSNGEFTGFYGANRVEPTAEIISRYIRDIFASEEKKSRRSRNVPTGITGFDIDGDFIFTCTASSTQTTDTVKKLNAVGKNNFSYLELEFGDIKPMYDTSQQKLLSPAIVDIDIADDGSINCLDRTTGRVFQYDEDCRLMFITGTKADQLGGFDTVSALETCGERLYVVDSVKDTVTVFRETDFGKKVHKAMKLYNDGFYEEALEPWYEVLRLDGNYRRAHIGIASALLRKGDYRGAMKYAKLADSPDIYNKAFEGYRMEFLKRNSGCIAAGIVIAAVLITALRKRRKKHLKYKRSGKREGKAE